MARSGCQDGLSANQSGNSMKLTVNELFYSIQGESTDAGRPCVFIRLTGCNLRCRYCDTQYAYHDGKPLSLGQILAAVGRFNCNLVEVTGGEPLTQRHTSALVERLLDSGYRVLMETNGSLDIDRVDRRCSRIMDIKCPSSGEHNRNDPANLARLTPNDQVKFVVGDQEDFRFAQKMAARLPESLPPDRILFAAIWGQLPLDRLARWLLDARFKARLQVPLHKVIWPGRDRGV